MLGGGLIDIDALRAVGAEIARAGKAEIEHAVALRLGKQRHPVDRPARQRALIFGAFQIERVFGQWAIATGRARRALNPSLMIIRNIRQPRFGGFGGGGIDQD